MYIYTELHMHTHTLANSITASPDNIATKQASIIQKQVYILETLGNKAALS